MSRSIAHIRIAQKEDCASIAKIYNHYLGKSTMDLEMKRGAYYDSILQNQDDMEEIWVIEEQGLIGWGIIKKYSDREGYKYTGETSVYLHPNHLNQGHGKTLKIHLMERCRVLGYHHLLARIFAENEVSIQYNLKLGYTLVGIQKEAGFVDNEWKDVAILQYIFPNKKGDNLT